jgi:hypothetical protein
MKRDESGAKQPVGTRQKHEVKVFVRYVNNKIIT